MTDKVKLYDDERLDIPDTSALQELVNESVMRALGGIIGRAGGLLTSMTFTATSNASNSWVTMGDGLILISTLASERTNTNGSGMGDNVPTPDNIPTARVVRHVPTSPYQQSSSTVDVTSVIDAGTFIWARRAEVDGDFDSRRSWVGGAETAAAVWTRSREQVIFDIGIQQPAQGFGWTKIGVIDSSDWSISGGNKKLATVRPLSPFDLLTRAFDQSNSHWTDDGITDDTRRMGTRVLNTDSPFGFGTLNAKQATLGFADAIAYIIKELAAIKGAAWDATPANDLTDIGTNVTNITTLQNADDTITSGLPVASGLIPGGTSTHTHLEYRPGYAVTASRPGGAGNYKLTVDHPSGAIFLSCMTTPRDSGNATAHVTSTAIITGIQATVDITVRVAGTASDAPDLMYVLYFIDP